MNALAAGLLAVGAASAIVGAQSTSLGSQALQHVVAAERAFAAATAQIGVRDGFLMFFADDAIELRDGANGQFATAGSAKDGLRSRAATVLPLASLLSWAPAAGQVSRDGTLGWLTGPYTIQVTTTHEVTAKGAYFSIWRRQADGTWRVWLDDGISLPDVWRPGAFEAMTAPAADPSDLPAETLADAERAAASGGPQWRVRLSDGVRLHRDGVMPVVGRAAAAAWVARTWARVRYVPIPTAAVGADDVSVELGGYEAAPAASAGPTSAAVRNEHGTWARVWARDESNRWRIVFETSKPAR